MPPDMEWSEFEHACRVAEGVPLEAPIELFTLHPSDPLQLEGDQLHEGGTNGAMAMDFEDARAQPHQIQQHSQDSMEVHDCYINHVLMMMGHDLVQEQNSLS